MAVAVHAWSPARALDVGWRVLVMALVYSVLMLPASLAQAGGSPAVQIGASLVTGAAYALLMLPLARHLPGRTGSRVLAIFLLLYWIGTLGNIVEALVWTSIARSKLIIGAVYLVVPVAAVSWLVAWLLPAEEPGAPGFAAVLRQRALLSWGWRVLVAGVLFAVALELAGKAWGPVISRYYADPAFTAQYQTFLPPLAIGVPDEVLRGVVFALVLLPLLATMTGRDRRSLLLVAAYIALIDAAVEGWLPMLAQPSYPLGFKLAEGVGDLGTDAIARGAFLALLLALPAARRPTAPPG